MRIFATLSPVLALTLGLPCAVQAADISLEVGQSQTFSATVLDQFGDPMKNQPTVQWSTTIGRLNTNRGRTARLTAPDTAGNGSVTASSQGHSRSRTIEVVDSSPDPVDDAPVAVIDPVRTIIDVDKDGQETLTLTQSSRDDHGIQSYAWSIGNSVVGKAKTLTHDFPVGKTTVRLTVTDTGGQPSKVAELEVHVQAGAPDDAPLTNIKASTGKNFQLIDLVVGANVYMDRSYAVRSFGDKLSGGMLLQTSNSDKRVTNAAHITAAVTKDVTLYIGLDKRSSAVPGWMRDWKPVSSAAYGLDSERKAAPYRMFKRDYAAGDALRLGGNEGVGESAYVVVLTLNNGGGDALPVPVDEVPVAAIDSIGPVTDSDRSGSETVTLTQSSSDDKGISRYAWSIGGQVVGAGQSLTYDFPVGSTTVSLVVTDTAGQASKPATARVQVKAGSVSQDVLTDIQASSNKAYALVDLKIGAKVYMDRRYAVGAHGDALQDAWILQTSNNDKNITNTTHIDAKVQEDVIVYVCLDKRSAVVPTWMKGWTRISDPQVGLTVNDGASPYRIYQRKYRAGDLLRLGGNNGSGRSHYVVLVASDIPKISG